MNTVDDYIAKQDPPVKGEFERIGGIVKDTVPVVTQGVSYGMAAYMYKTKPLIGFVANKKFLSLYPFSGKVIDKTDGLLDGFEHTSGSVHFSVEKPLPEHTLKELVLARKSEIDALT